MKGIWKDNKLKIGYMGAIKNELKEGFRRVYVICDICNGRGGRTERFYNPLKPNPRPNCDEDYIYKWVDCVNCEATGLLDTPYITKLEEVKE